jgi:UDP-glucose:glycoprotein glucosyltransferase
MRVSFIHNPTTIDREPGARPPASWLISHLLGRNLLSKASPARLLKALGVADSVIQTEGSQIPLSDDGLTDGVGISGYSSDDYDKYVKSCRLVARNLQIVPGELALIVNGRVSTPTILF